MEFLKSARRRTLWSELVYYALNVLMAVALLAAVFVVTVPWPAFGLVLLSKWRIFAVRSRYWVANIRANMIDIIVGVSHVIFLYGAAGNLPVQIGLTVFYIAWLLYIKPRSKRAFVTIQAHIGVFYGIAAIAQLSPAWPVSLVVALAWIVGYSGARHVMSVQHESHINFLSLLWAFIIAEIMWLFYHFTLGYQVTGEFAIPQVAVLIVVMGFLAERIYTIQHKTGKVELNDILLPGMLVLGVTALFIFDTLHKLLRGLVL